MIPARSKTSKVRDVSGGKILQKNGPSCMQSSAFFSVLSSFLHIQKTLEFILSTPASKNPWPLVFSFNIRFEVA